MWLMKNSYKIKAMSEMCQNLTDMYNDLRYLLK